MVKHCCAVGCHNTYKKGSGIQFYRFPTDPERRSKWVNAVSREGWTPSEYSWICSKHFISGTKSNNPLAPNYVQTIFSHVESPAKRRMEGRMDDFYRRQSMKWRRVSSTIDEATTVNTDDLPDSQVTDKHPQVTDEQLVSNATEELSQRTPPSIEEQLQSRVKELEKELETLQKHRHEENLALHSMKSSFLFRGDQLSDDDKKVKYYTGLPSYSVLKAIFDFVSTDLELPDHMINGKKSLFEQLVLVLMKLRLNLGDQDLAYRFQIGQATVSRYFNSWLDVLYSSLSFVIRWPERGELLKTMPMDFRKHFRKCVVIIDCFEIFIEHLTSLSARAQTWSNYKHHNTAKFLIGITPQGSIAYVSQGWGGRTSDVFITENSELLSKLLPGDMILADRGFTIEDTARLYCAEVKVPPFTKGKKQLSRVEVDSARRLSRVRIHVERVIGMIRQKYTVLQSTFPINMLMCQEEETESTLDKIVTVCCALCNCCDSVVPTD